MLVDAVGRHMQATPYRNHPRWVVTQRGTADDSPTARRLLECAVRGGVTRVGRPTYRLFCLREVVITNTAHLLRRESHHMKRPITKAAVAPT